MNRRRTIDQRPPVRRGGFALVSTLFLLALATLLIVGLLGILGTDTQRTGQDRDLAEARANARHALGVALAELQRYAGPDQAATGTADLIDPNVPNPRWTGVWGATGTARENGSRGAFLVSGNEAFDIGEETTEYPAGYLDPTDPLPDPAPGNESVWLVDEAAGGAASPDSRVKVRKQPLLDAAGGRRVGSYAYWVGDEGVKAKVNLRDPYAGSTDPAGRGHRLGAAQSNRVQALLPGVEPADPRLDAVGTEGEMGLLAGDMGLVRDHFHDLTTHSWGLLTDTRNGGLQRDLTMAFENDEIFLREFGVTSINPPGGSFWGEVNDSYTLDSERLEEFYIDEGILETALARDSNVGRWAGGPNWGTMRGFYNLHRRSEFPFLPHPTCGVRMRLYSWNPYKHGNIPGRTDLYQRNSPVVPVLARAQVNLRLKTRLHSGSEEDGDAKYVVEWEVKPVVALWNPFNVAFIARRYTFDWEVSASIKLEVGGKEREYDLSMLWGSNDEWLRLQTDANYDLQPGEIRMFTAAERAPIRQTVKIVPRWDDDGAFFVALPEEPPTRPGQLGAPLLVDSGDQIKVEEVRLIATRSRSRSGVARDLEKHNTFMAVKYREAPGDSGTAVSSSSIRMANLWQANDDAGPLAITGIPPISVRDAEDEAQPLASWAYYLRTAREDRYGNRAFIDSNVRAIVANSRWDGSVESRGWNAIGWLGDGDDRAALPPGNDEPESDGLERYRGFGGNSTGAAGQTHMVLFDVPRARPLSLGRFQHAALGRYNNEPSFVFANSYHNIRIPPSQTLVRNFGMHDSGGVYDPSGLDVFDLSYRVNERVWDRYFLSTLDPALTDAQLEALRLGETHLPNSRLKIYDPGGALAADDLTSGSDPLKYDALAGHLMIDGAFNVNSTSVAAWKTVLSSLADIDIPILDPLTGTLDRWEKGDIVFSRFMRPLDGAFNAGDAGSADRFWRGYRELDEEQIERIAEELVEQVRMRGPFRSLADFVNRSLVDHDPSGSPADDTRLAGALQMAIDRAAGGNAALDPSLAADAAPVPDDPGAHGWEFHDVAEGSSQGAGFAGFLLQGDVLQALGPILRPRSDTFRIRAYGDKIHTGRDGETEVRARAWCEAIVQRLPEALEPLGEAPDPDRDLIQSPEDIEAVYREPDRPYFGRRFRIVSFRWLKASDL